VAFELQPTLKGDLLELRPLQATDLGDLFAVAADPLNLGATSSQRSLPEEGP